jgi:hypothetical protein
MVIVCVMSVPHISLTLSVMIVPSCGLVVPMSEAFVRNIEQFVADERIDLVSFDKKQRKDDVTQSYLKSFRRNEGVLYVGKAQEKARVMRTERRRSRFTGGTYPWIVESTAMVNHYYFYAWTRTSARSSSSSARIFRTMRSFASMATSTSSTSLPSARCGSRCSTTASNPVPTPS